ncbi:hypothetical protein F7725_013313, partial [Dissostichus mawsoni]
MADTARDPPPDHTDFHELEDGEDLFPEPTSTLESGPASLPAEDISTNSNGPKRDSLFDDDTEDLFAEATEEVSLDSPERDVLLSDGPSPAITPITPPSPSSPPASASPMMTCSHTPPSTRLKRRRATIHSTCTYQSLTQRKWVRDGMNAYMAYKVSIKTSISLFKSQEFSVKRRFSDFLGLHSKLASKYLHIGYIVPPAPEKSIVGMTKVKVGKEDQSSNEFVEKRRSALERYLMRTVKHPILLKDPDVLQFLESSEALSSAGLLRMVNKAAEAVNKMTIKMNESDALRKLHASVESLVCHRKEYRIMFWLQTEFLLSSPELSVNTAQFAKSAAMLGNSEDHTALSRALSQLAEVEEKIDQLHQDQANADFYLFSEACLTIVSRRGRSGRTVRCSCRRNETEAKLQFNNKPDKLQQAKDEIKELEGKVEQGERDFEQISKTIRKEVSRFEKERVTDFKAIIIKYLESLVQTQQ